MGFLANSESMLSKARARTGQMDRQTDTQTDEAERITTSAFLSGNNANTRTEDSVYRAAIIVTKSCESSPGSSV